MKQRSSPPAPHAKCGPQTSGTGITQEFVTNAETQAPPQPDASGHAFEQETRGMCLYIQGWETLPFKVVPASPCASQSPDVRPLGGASPGVFKWNINLHSWSYKEHLPLTTKFLQPPMRAWYAHTHTHTSTGAAFLQTACQSPSLVSPTWKSSLQKHKALYLEGPFKCPAETQGFILGKHLVLPGD